MSFFTDLFFSTQCVACSELIETGKRDTPFCDGCLKKWNAAKAEARKGGCGHPNTVYRRGDAVRGDSGRALYAVRYHTSGRDAVQNRFILHIKSRCDRVCAAFAARELLDLIKDIPLIGENTVVAWIPASRESVRKRGFDRMEKVAKQLAKMLRAKAKRCLKRSRASSEQKHLDGDGRFENARRGILLSGRADVKGKTVILIDDVITSGASMNVASHLLASAGADRIIAAAIAMAD